MIDTILSTGLVLLREGFESVLLTGMITAAADQIHKRSIYANFAITWVTTLVIGWFAIDWIWPRIEDIEHILMLTAGAVLIYIFFASKAIFEHAKEHVSHIRHQSWLVLQVSVFLIVLREALESTVFLGSQIYNDPTGTIVGLALGVPILFAIVWLFNKFGRRLIGQLMFRWISWALLLLGLYYLWHGINGIMDLGLSFDLS